MNFWRKLTQEITEILVSECVSEWCCVCVCVCVCVWWGERVGVAGR